VNFCPAKSSPIHLWAWQNDRGEIGERKSRPTCVAVAVRSAKDDLAHLASCCTTKAPLSDRVAIEVLDTEARRAGLSNLNRWVIVDEYNYDIAERSWYIELDGNVISRFSRAFMMKFAGSFGEASRRSGRRINQLD
jgi:hypothetical protein